MKNKLLPIIQVLMVLLVFFGLFSAAKNNSYFKKQILTHYAEKVIEVCKDVRYRPGCYDEEIPKLMDIISMEDAFKVTHIVQQKDSVYVYCHVLAHELSAREVVKNPAGWKDVATRAPSGQCSNGGLHGAFQERFRSEVFTQEKIDEMKPELTILCEERSNWKPTRLEQASCYHALGHLTMFLTEADIKWSLALCTEFSLKPNRDLRQICYDGAFMQIFQPLEPEDFSLIKGKEVSKEKLLSFCKQFTGEQYGSCWSEGWPLFIQELRKPAGLVAYCSKSLPNEIDRCFDSTMHVMSAQFNLDSVKIKEYCLGLPKERMPGCFASSAARMIEVDYGFVAKAVDMCVFAEPYDDKHLCFKELLKYAGYNYHIGSDEFFEVCEALPPEWEFLCFEKIQ